VTPEQLERLVEAVEKIAEALNSISVGLDINGSLSVGIETTSDNPLKVWNEVYVNQWPHLHTTTEMDGKAAEAFCTHLSNISYGVGDLCENGINVYHPPVKEEV